MAQDIVQGLFGIDPDLLRQNRLNQLENSAFRMAQLDPFQRATMGMYQAGGMLGGAAAQGLGMVHPAEEQARMAEQAISGIDPNNPDSILERAQQIQDPRLKLRLAQYAQGLRAQQQQLQSEAEKVALGERKQDFQEQQIFDLRKMEAEARIRQNDERIKDARTTAEERIALMRESNQIKMALGQMANALSQQKAASKAEEPKKLSFTDARSIDRSFKAAESANPALQLLDSADQLYGKYESNRAEPILGGAARIGAALGMNKERAADYEMASQIAKDLGVIKLGLIGGSDTERELQVAIDTSPSPDKTVEANRRIIANQRRAIQVLQAEPDFKTEWVNKHGSLTAIDKATGETFGKAWRKYQKENFKTVDTGKKADDKAVPAGVPTGSKLVGKTPDGKPVYQSPDGKKWVQ